jgi:hypothetical protein
VKEAIDRMLEQDRQVPRKQRHTAHRVWTRLREEAPTIRSASQPCGDTCGNGNKKWDWDGRKRSCRRATTGARKARWIGLRRWPNWMGNCAS